MKILLRSVVVLLLFAMPSPLQAQWLKHPAPGLPRTGNGAPNSPPPRPARRMASLISPAYGAWTPVPLCFYIPGDLKPNEIKPWAGELRSTARRTTWGVMTSRSVPPRRSALQSFRRVSEKDRSNTESDHRSVRRLVVSADFLDGRPRCPRTESEFHGLLRGPLGRRHAGGRKHRIQGRDVAGLRRPSSNEALRLTERYRRLDFGHMEIQEKFQDPDIYSRPLTVRVKATLVPNTDLLEYVCAENEVTARVCSGRQGGKGIHASNGGSHRSRSIRGHV